MNDLYRKTFDEIHASEALRQEVLNMTKQEQTTAKRHIPRMLLIAAVIVLALAGTAVAASLSGMQSWFSRQWTKETGRAIEKDQMGIITGLTDEVGASVEADGVTVTVDSITRGEDVIWCLVEIGGLPSQEELQKRIDALERPVPAGEVRKDSINGTSVMTGSEADVIAAMWDEADSIPMRYGFDSMEAAFDAIETSPGMRISWEVEQDGVREDGSRTLLLKYFPDLIGEATLLDAQEVTLKLENLTWGNFVKEITLAEGPWELNFSLPAIEPEKPLTTGGGAAIGERREEDWDFASMGAWPREEAPFRDIRVTSTGLTVFWADSERSAQLNTVGDWYLMTRDGSEVRVNTDGHSYYYLPDGQMTSRYHWPVPVDLEQAESLEYRYNEEVRSFALK